jgi:hypothetical protein
MTGEGALARADLVCFRAGCKAQSRERQSESKTAASADTPTAVVSILVCRRNHPPASLSL